MHATYLAYLVLLDLINRILFGEGYRLWITVSCGLDAGFSSQSLEFGPVWIDVWLVVTEVVLEQVCLRMSSGVVW
jgi:hypothetical protein